MASKAQVKKFNGNYFLNIQNFLPEEVMGGLLESCDELITKIVAENFNLDGYLDELSLAYWVSINIGDERRAGAIHNLIAVVLVKAEDNLESHRNQIEMWRSPEFIGPVNIGSEEMVSTYQPQHCQLLC